MSIGQRYTLADQAFLGIHKGCLRFTSPLRIPIYTVFFDERMATRGLIGPWAVVTRAQGLIRILVALDHVLVGYSLATRWTEGGQFGVMVSPYCSIVPVDPGVISVTTSFQVPAKEPTGSGCGK